MQNNNQQQANPQQPGPKPAERPYKSLRDFTQRNEVPNVIPTDATKFFDRVQEIVDDAFKRENNVNVNVYVVKYDGIDALAITSHMKEDYKVAAFFVFFPIDLSQFKPRYQVKPIVSRQVIDNEIISNLMADLRRQFGSSFQYRVDSKEAEIMFSNMTFIPSYFHYLETYEYAFGVTHAAVTENMLLLGSHSESKQPLNLSQLAPKISLHFEVNYANTEPLVHRTGTVIRSDVELTLYESSILGGHLGSKFSIGSVYGYFDLIWNESSSGKKYLPRFIVTAIESSAVSSELNLLLLSCVNGLAKDKNWYSGFLHAPRIAGKNPLLQLVKENSQLQGISDKKEDEKDTVARILNELVEDCLIVSIDIPLISGFSAGFNVFQDAKAGDHVAIKTIFNQADNLTNGRFYDLFKRAQSEQVFISTNEAVLIGTGWQAGLPRNSDLRFFDYLQALSALCEKEMNEYVAVHLPSGVENSEGMPYQSSGNYLFSPLLLRKVALYQEMLNHFKVIDIGERLTFTSLFLNILCEAICQTGTRIVYKSVNDEPGHKRPSSGMFL